MRGARTLACTAVALLALTAAALAVTPRRSAHFRGIATMYMNDGPHWNRAGTEVFSFRTSSSGRAMLGFRGSYAYYCGAGTGTVTARSVVVSSKGHFRYDFWVPSHGPNGKVNGRTYFSIYGDFFAGGSKANVNYLFDYVQTGLHVKHPYTPGNGRGLGCASWVRGVAKAR